MNYKDLIPEFNITRVIPFYDISPCRNCKAKGPEGMPCSELTEKRKCPGSQRLNPMKFRDFKIFERKAYDHYKI